MSQPKTRYSKQREIIYEVLKDDMTHPNVDTIYMNVKKIIPDISLGTVYRNLNLLADQHIIRRLDVGDGVVHFDAKIKPHYHLICDDCGCIKDLIIDELHLASFIEQAQKKCEGQIMRADVTFHGTCPECLKKKS